MSSTNKVLINTIIIYVRLILGMAISLFTIRIILNTLGEIDYGIYSLVAGVIGMLAFLNSSMSGVSLRFIAINLGSKNYQKVNTVFNSTLLIHFIIGMIIVLIMLITSIFLFDGILNIPNERVFDARIVYYLMILSTFFTVISVPYDALISANEDFIMLSFIELFGVLVNLFIALYLTKVTSYHLITYGILITVNQMVIRLLKQIYSRYKYKSFISVRIFKLSDKKTVSEILSFTGWKTLDSSSTVLYSQLRGVLINIFFGVTLNAANGIAKQVSAQLQNLAASLLKAINPQIMKSEGSGDREKMLDLTSSSAKFSLFLMSIFALPIIFELPFILELWLKNVPEYTVVFCRLILIEMIISKYTFQINTAIAAVGKVRGITIIVFVNRVLQFILSYYVFSKGYPPESIYYVAILFDLLAIIYKLYFGNRIANLNILKYVKNVIFKGSLPIIITMFFSFCSLFLFEEGLARFIITTLATVLIMIFSIYWVGLYQSERMMVKKLIIQLGKRKP